LPEGLHIGDLCTIVHFGANQGEKIYGTAVCLLQNEDFIDFFNADVTQKGHGAEVSIVLDPHIQALEQSGFLSIRHALLASTCMRG